MVRLCFEQDTVGAAFDYCAKDTLFCVLSDEIYVQVTHAQFAESCTNFPIIDPRENVAETMNSDISKLQLSHY